MTQTNQPSATATTVVVTSAPLRLKRVGKRTALLELCVYPTTQTAELSATAWPDDALSEFMFFPEGNALATLQPLAARRAVLHIDGRDTFARAEDGEPRSEDLVPICRLVEVNPSARTATIELEPGIEVAPPKRQ